MSSISAGATSTSGDLCRRVLARRAIVESLTASHVSAIRAVAVGELFRTYRSVESAELYWEQCSHRTARARRIASALTVPAGLSLPSIHNLGRQAFELRADLTVGRGQRRLVPSSARHRTPLLLVSPHPSLDPQ